MRREVLISLMILALCGSVLSQGKFLTNEGNIVFFSHTAIEDITAENTEVAGVLDSETGEVAVIVKMTSFQFEKSKMQEHFNENYVESEKYPKATFTGHILNNTDVDYSRPGVYEIQVKGEMTIHGASRSFSTEGSLEVESRNIAANMKFMLNPEEYYIKIPRVVRENIAEKMEVRVQMNLKPI